MIETGRATSGPGGLEDGRHAGIDGTADLVGVFADVKAAPDGEAEPRGRELVDPRVRLVDPGGVVGDEAGRVDEGEEPGVLEHGPDLVVAQGGGEVRDHPDPQAEALTRRAEQR